jgi:hypothetical protein
LSISYFKLNINSLLTTRQYSMSTVTGEAVPAYRASACAYAVKFSGKRVQLYSAWGFHSAVPEGVYFTYPVPGQGRKEVYQVFLYSGF